VRAFSNDQSTAKVDGDGEHPALKAALFSKLMGMTVHLKKRLLDHVFGKPRIVEESQDDSIGDRSMLFKGGSSEGAMILLARKRWRGFWSHF
jgi:hypothetical protein